MQQDEEMTDLRKENEALKQRLQEYQSLEEDLMAERVFEKARKKLTLYITLGGLVLLLSSTLSGKL